MEFAICETETVTITQVFFAVARSALIFHFSISTHMVNTIRGTLDIFLQVFAPES